MYVPEENRVTDKQEIFRFIEANGFGIFITQLSGLPMATSIPMLIHETGADAYVLTGHFSKENKQAESLIDGTNALAVFNGAHAYVSSSWYSHENVSTWNYLSAQVSGKLYVMDQLELIESLHRMTEKYEKTERKPKYFENISEKVIRENLTGVIGFRVLVDSMEASFKLSQNRNRQDHQRIVDELQKRGDAGSGRIADEMKKRTPES